MNRWLAVNWVLCGLTIFFAYSGYLFLWSTSFLAQFFCAYKQEATEDV